MIMMHSIESLNNQEEDSEIECPLIDTICVLMS
jgi:hypothetical protein